MRPGDLVAVGRTSDVYEFGAGAVVKVPRPDVPDHWAPLEARFTAAVRACGVAAPEVLDLTQVDGRNAIVFERIDGRSLWMLMVEHPDRVPELARLLADTQRLIFAAGPPEGLDGIVERTRRKLSEVRQLSADERTEAIELVERLPAGASLLHGDLHPGNVLMGADGPVVIDWFDASIGHPVADVVRSSLLMRPYADAAPPHLPGATAALLDRLHRAYLTAMAESIDQPAEVIRGWETAKAASRLSEGPQPDGPALLALWQQRHAAATGPLTELLGSGGATA